MTNMTVEKISSSLEEENHHLYGCHISGLEIFHIKVNKPKWMRDRDAKSVKIHCRGAEEDCRRAVELDSNPTKMCVVTGN
ncbi:hypothetical protein MKX01_032428 [Papaver californicum]|nr:hypothetical protein MKX01_032428 [Papaver californicum]